MFMTVSLANVEFSDVLRLCSTLIQNHHLIFIQLLMPTAPSGIVSVACIKMKWVGKK